MKPRCATCVPDFGRLRGVRGARRDGHEPGGRYPASISSRATSRRRSGIDEDPVTGSTHCCLGPFWSRPAEQAEFVARQVSERGGVLKVALDGERVRLGGQAVTVLRGELMA